MTHESALLDRHVTDFVEAVRLAATWYSHAELAVWLTAPQPLLDHWTPLQLLGSGRAPALLQIMNALDQGAYL